MSCVDVGREECRVYSEGAKSGSRFGILKILLQLQ